ncbi:MAG TPA: polysaccharide deacetylase family protein [Nitrospiraceae bacterium]|nr:polysaccharide deacetylase family protein [Nitrospiraceae bacterium]
MNLNQWARSTARRGLGSLMRVQTTQRVVALTFDDGPDPASTPPLLDLLKSHQARGTFFTVGVSVERYPDLIRRMAEEGHALGSHSWDHSAFPLLSGSERRRQLHACEHTLGRFGRRLFRPPYGEQTVASRLDAWRLGFDVVGWSVTSEDWYEPSAAVMTQVLLQRIGPGDIVLLHDSIFDKGAPQNGPRPDRPSWVDRRAMLAALETVFAQIGNHYRFVTVPELLECGTPCYSYWFKQTARPGGLGPLERLLKKLG